MVQFEFYVIIHKRCSEIRVSDGCGWYFDSCIELLHVAAQVQRLYMFEPNKTATSIVK
jgi:hypothetical protein